MPVYYTTKLNPSCPKSVFLKIHTRHKWQFCKLLGQCTLKLRRTDQASSKLLRGTGRDKKRKKAAHERPINQRPKRHNSNMLPRHAHLWPVSSFFSYTCCEVWGRPLRNTKWVPKTYSQRFTAARFVVNPLLAIGRLEEGLESPSIWEWKDVRTSSYASIHLPWQNLVKC